MRVRIHRFPISNSCNKEKLESNHHLNKQTLSVTSPVNQMVIGYGGKSHRVAAW